MKKFQLIILVLIFISGKLLFAEDSKIIFEKGSWSEILSIAGKENKLVFLDAYASWCGPCKWMVKNVFSNDTAAEFYNRNFINAQIDMEKGEGIELAKKYGVMAYPTFFYINSNGEVVHRTCGSCPVSDFIQNGKNALDPETQLISIKRKFEANPENAELAAKLFNLMENGCMKYDNELEKYLGTQKESDLINPTNWQIINKYLSDTKSNAFKLLIANKKDFISKYSKDTIDNKLRSVYENSLSQLIRSGDKKGFQNLKKEVKNAGISDADELIATSDLSFFKRNKEWKNYLITAGKLADKFKKDDCYFLNGVSWTVFENFSDKPSLLKAEKWAKRSVDIKDEYFNNDTYANILFKLGKKQEAKIAAEKAIDLAKKEGADYKETEDLLNKIIGK
jgi:thiol-disulfide isomerase/thioredoxin